MEVVFYVKVIIFPLGFSAVWTVACYRDGVVWQLEKVETARRVKISNEVRKTIKHEQGCRCLMCGEQKPIHDLYIHHVIPVSHHEAGQDVFANRRENLCALCAGCHDYADHLALEDKIYLRELIDMVPDIEYPVKRTRRIEPQPVTVAQQLFEKNPGVYAQLEEWANSPRP